MGKGSWSRRRHMTEAWSSTEAGRRIVRQYAIKEGENDDVLVQRMHISWGRKAWCGAHLVGEKSTFVVADVVAESDVGLSGEDHVESRC
ncbi:hypothetical protein DY000_02026123 [Brassica cretica]|uniref:Uncharacterized protein n=1 Tax=Brassica cretica TaxID=69181 RepID=A0ABQ7E9L3_BRACR|nr:hypothetical protein DY000_02026123 [Brassica cretica]